MTHDPAFWALAVGFGLMIYALVPCPVGPSRHALPAFLAGLAVVAITTAVVVLG